MTNRLGILEPVDLRKVWPNEERDFTPWLANEDNLAVLGEALGMSLEFVSREEAVGPYSADILCRDSSDGTQVVVENQLESSDHDHLGKLLTYAAHLGATVLVWIAKRFTDQHRAALDWLNEVSDAETRFFGLEVELWRIGDSVPAPKFNLVARPNDWTGGKAELTDTQRLQLRFWEGFADFASRKGTVVTKPRAPRPEASAGLVGFGRTGFFLHGVMSTWSESGDHELRAELVITGKRSDHRFRQLQADRHGIEQQNEFPEELEWHNPAGVKQRRIYWRLQTDFDDPDARTEQYRWLLERVETLHRIMAPRIRDLPTPE